MMCFCCTIQEVQDWTKFWRCFSARLCYWLVCLHLYWIIYYQVCVCTGVFGGEWKKERNLPDLLVVIFKEILDNLAPPLSEKYWNYHFMKNTNDQTSMIVKYFKRNNNALFVYFNSKISFKVQLILFIIHWEKHDMYRSYLFSFGCITL